MRYMTTYYWQDKNPLLYQNQGMGAMGREDQGTGAGHPGSGEDSRENRTSLVLAQYRYRNIPLCFACVCGAEGAGRRAGAYLSGRLLCWQQELPWGQIARKPEKWLPKLESGLIRVLEQIDRELSDSGLTSRMGETEVAGILCAGVYGLVFSRGTQGVYLLHVGFGKGCIRQIRGGGTGQEKGKAVWHEGEENLSAREGYGEGWGKLRLQQGILEQDVGFLVATKSFGRVVAREDTGTCLYVQEVESTEQAERHLGELGKCGEALGETDMGAVMLYARKGEQDVPPEPMDIQKGKPQFGSGKNRQKAMGKSVRNRERPGRPGEIQGELQGIHGKRRQGGLQEDVPAGKKELPAERKVEEADRDFLKRHGYQVQHLLGQGAFSRVYLARRTAGGENVACKVSTRTELIGKEGRLLQRLAHPLFATYNECWQEGDRGCLAMEYVPGSSLEALLRRQGRLSARRAVQVTLELAEGLRYLHTMQDAVLFRDVKPANIMIRQDGRVKLLDLGCACLLEEADTARAGTPGFGAPEQFGIQGRAGPASDVYGVGQVLRAMLGGTGKTQERNRGGRRRWTGKKCFSKRPGGYWSGERTCCSRLRKIAAICTRQEPEERFPDMQCLVKALSSCLPGGHGGEGTRRGNIHRNVRAGKSLLCEKNIWKSTCKNY